MIVLYFYLKLFVSVCMMCCSIYSRARSELVLARGNAAEPRTLLLNFLREHGGAAATASEEWSRAIDAWSARL